MKKRLMALLLALTLCLCAAVPVWAAEIPAERLLPRLVDDADLLSSSDEDSVLSKLDKISEALEFDVVIVTTDTLGGKSPRAFADDFFDYNGYGFGPDADGILLLVSTEDRDWYISTCGYGITAFTDAGIDYIGDRLVEKLGEEHYFDACLVFADLCEDFVKQARTGSPYDRGSLPKEPFKFFGTLLVCLLLGFGVALIVVFVMKAQLKSVHSKAAAADYVRAGSLNITDSHELFLHRRVDRRAKPKDSGSSTHRSSSGRSHGGGGGKF